MTDNETLMKQAESHAVLRRVLLIVNALSYVGWIGSSGLAHMGTLSVDPATLSLVQMVCWPVWLISLIRIFWTMMRLGKRRDIGALVDDERTQGVSAKSFQIGYWALLLAITGVYAANFFVPVDVKLVGPFLLALGVAAPSLTYALLYRS